MSEQETDALRREIERTRAELGATVEALSHKADVKTQAREKVEHAKQNVQAQAQERPIAPLAAGIAAALVVLWLIRRRRS
jgi:type VI protein secretion system component VasF